MASERNAKLISAQLSRANAAQDALRIPAVRDLVVGALDKALTALLETDLAEPGAREALFAAAAHAQAAVRIENGLLMAVNQARSAAEAASRNNQGGNP